MTKEVLYYTDLTDRPDISILEKSNTKKCLWHTALPLLTHGFTNLKDLFIEPYTPTVTAKVCPGIRGVLNKSILVRSPCDIAITIYPDSSHTWHTPDVQCEVSLSPHSLDQVIDSEGEYKALFSNKLFLKINLPVIIKAKKGSPYVFLQPHYHNTLPYEVIQAEVPGSFTKKSIDLNIIGMYSVPKKDPTVHIIKKGQVLAYIWGGWENISLRSITGLKRPIKFKFLGG